MFFAVFACHVRDADVCGAKTKGGNGDGWTDGRMDEVIDGSSSLPSFLQDQDPLHSILVDRPTETDLIPSSLFPYTATGGGGTADGAEQRRVREREEGEKQRGIIPR